MGVFGVLVILFAGLWLWRGKRDLRRIKRRRQEQRQWYNKIPRYDRHKRMPEIRIK